MIGVFIMEMLLINNLKKREKEESFEQSRNDILANVLKIKRQNLLENYSKDKIEENQLYFSLDVEINFLIDKKWYSNERKSQYLYEKADEFNLTREDINLKGKNNKYSLKEIILYDYDKQEYTNNAEIFIKEKIGYNDFFNKELLPKLEVKNGLINVKKLIKIMDKIIEEKETGTYKMQVDLVECIYHKFRLEIESNPLVRKEDERTKELNAKFKTKTFLEKNYYAISEMLIKEIIEKNRKILA